MQKRFVKIRESDADYLQMDVRPVLPVVGVAAGMLVGLIITISGLEPYVGLMLVVVSPLAASYAPKKTVVLDRAADKLAIHKRGRLAAATGPPEVSCTLSEITAVEVVGSKSDKRKVRTELVLADDKRLAIERPFSVFAAKHQVVAAALQGFLWPAPSETTGEPPGEEPGDGAPDPGPDPEAPSETASATPTEQPEE